MPNRKLAQNHHNLHRHSPQANTIKKLKDRNLHLEESVKQLQNKIKDIESAMSKIASNKMRDKKKWSKEKDSDTSQRNHDQSEEEKKRVNLKVNKK